MAPLSTVASSPWSTGASFHRETIFALARSLAKIPDVGWNEVERALFVHCPKIGDDNQARKLLPPSPFYKYRYLP